MKLNLLPAAGDVAPTSFVRHTLSVNFRATCSSMRLLSLVLVSGVLTFAGGCDDESAAPARDAGVPGDAATPIDAATADDAAVPEDASMDAALDAAISLPDGDFEADYCQPLAQLICERADQCGCGAVVPSGTLDVEACEAQWLGQCTQSYAQLIELVTAGQAHVLGEEARACVARIAELTPQCEAPQGTLISFALCEPFFASATPLGESCEAVPLCALGDGACIEGMCVPRVAEGGECEGEFACQTGLACLGGHCGRFGSDADDCSPELRCAPPLHCVAGKCGALKGSGADCADASECEQGLVCNGDGQCAARTSETCSEAEACGNLELCAAPRACTARIGADEACTSDRQCLPELYCGDDGKCVARPGEGAPCVRDSLCVPGLACTFGVEPALCQPLPTEGQPCALDENGPFVCSAGLGCGFDNTCEPLPGEHEVCAMPNVCADGLACDFTPNGSFCVEPKPLGGECQNEVVCGADAHCGNGMCTADQEDGTPCTVGNECRQVCAPSDSGAHACVATRGEGDACTFDDDCPVEMACKARAGRVGCVPEICTAL
jgi:hypothetical protein